jgi:hypothetical protein
MSKLKYYEWQKEIIEYEGDETIRGGRQTGKSWAVAQRILTLAEKYPGCRILIIAPAGRQEGYLRDKCLEILGKDYKFRRRQVKEWLPMKNKTDIFIYPVGKTGVYVEGLSSIDFLFAEEAGHIKEEVFDAIMPMLAEPRKRGLGWITLLGNTRRCKLNGFYYKSFQNKKFKHFHIKTAEQEHISKEFIEDEKKRLGEKKFKVIYEGEFDESAFRYFPEELVLRNVKFKYWKIDKDYNENNKYFLGIDPARYGKCKAGFVVSELTKGNDKIRLIYSEGIPKSSLRDLRDKCLELDQKFKKFKKLYIDDGGFGAGLVDILEEEFKQRLRPLNNKSKGKEFKILKEDLYSNFLKLLEKGEVEIIEDPELIEGLLNVEVDEEEKIKGTDLSEAAVRATWAWKEKPGRLWVK